MRKKIVAGNWKMNKTAQEAFVLATEVAELVKSSVSADVQVIMSTPALYLTGVNQVIEGIPNLAVAAQNCHEKASGAYTGEISAPMLASAGVQYVILGHSERRQYFAETNEQLAAKTDAALANGLTPLFCCGESLFHLSAEDFAKVVIAYEPIWAIGTGLTASSDQAQEMHAYLRAHIAKQYGQSVADSISILYGGSCNAKNAKELFACPDVDGGLIGGASLVAADFITIATSY
jgi:triosephosphate isomerase